MTVDPLADHARLRPGAHDHADVDLAVGRGGRPRELGAVALVRRAVEDELAVVEAHPVDDHRELGPADA